MRKLAVPVIIFLGLALLIGTIGYVVSARAPASVTAPASASMPITVPAVTPTPTLFPAPALPPAIEQGPASDNVSVHQGEQPPILPGSS